jgi:WD40 repeat protein
LSGPTHTAAASQNAAVLHRAPERELHLPPLPTHVRDQQRYDILGEHGRGGLGRVSRAHDRELGRDVAIKELLSRDHANEIRFLREVLITARLEHPGIVPVHEAGRWADGTPFYAMKLVAGRPLRDLIAERATVEERIGLLHHVIAVTDAIAYAHGRNIIHRDLKPGNVIVGDFGETIVIDWGLAKDLTTIETSVVGGGPFRTSLGNDEDLTSTGSIVGTPGYMAPEQQRGEPVDQRADVFAIGMMLWELCAPRKAPPPRGHLRHRVLRHAGVDEDLATIIEKALDPDPMRRYRDAGALAADLKAFKSGARIGARSYSLLGVLAHWTRRHRALALSVTTGVAVVIAGSAFYVRSIATERDRADAALEAVEATNHKLASERGAVIEQRNMLILAQATAALDSDPTRALESLKTYPLDGADWDQVQVVAADAQSRGVARHILPAMSQAIAMFADGKAVLTAGPREHVQIWDLATGTQRHALSARGPVTMARISPDSTTIAIGGRRGDLALWNPVAGTQTLLGTVDGGVFYLAFSPDGKTLASSSLHEVVLWGLTTHRRIWSMTSSPVVTILAMSPGGRTLAFGSSDGTLQLWDVAQQLVHRYAGHAGAIDVIAFSSDENWLVTGGRDHTVRLWNATTGGGRVLGSHAGLVRAAAFSPTDPTLVASGGTDREVRLWSTTGKPSRVFSGHTDMVNSVAFSPDGLTLASLGPDRQVRLWEVATGDSRVLDGHRGDLGDALFSPDGSLLISSGYDEGTRVWRVAPPPGRLLGRHEFEALQAVFSPDGRFVASAGSDRTARLWEISSGREHMLAGAEYTAMAFATGVVFSESGDWLAGVGDNAARLWNLRTGTVRRFVAPETLLRKVAITRDGKVIAAAGSDGTIRVWDAASNHLTLLAGHTGEVTTIAFLPRGDRLVSAATDGTARIWDLSSSPPNSQVLAAHGAAVTELAVAPGGDLIASASRDGKIQLWRAGGQANRILVGHIDAITGLRFSSDGRQLASSSMDHTARIWNVATGESRALNGHDEAVRAIDFAPDGRTVATGSNDRTVRLWNLETGAMAVLRGHRAAVRSVAYDAGGTRLATASEDAAVRLWDVGRVPMVPKDRAHLVPWLQAQTSAALRADSSATSRQPATHDP